MSKFIIKIISSFSIIRKLKIDCILKIEKNNDKTMSIFIILRKILDLKLEDVF